MEDILAPILKSPKLPEIIKELEEYWQTEQKHRHEFWATYDESVKAEFIEGQVIYHSPIYSRHWKVSSNIVGFLLPLWKSIG